MIVMKIKTVIKSDDEPVDEGKEWDSDATELCVPSRANVAAAISDESETDSPPSVSDSIPASATKQDLTKSVPFVVNGYDDICYNNVNYYLLIHSVHFYSVFT